VEFHRIYNDALRLYREINRLRSKSHPVPELARDDDWYETPFWVWQNVQPQRKHLFARQVGAGIELTDRDRFQATLSLSNDSDAENASHQLAELAAAGVRVRPRALITTMYARLVLSDLFYHGIGGAKYDQLTNLLIDRFFGLIPPNFMTLTATILLPIEREPFDEDELSRIHRQLRELCFHPEKYAIISAETKQLAETKQRWIETELPRGERRPRQMAIEQVNAALQPAVAQQRAELLKRQEYLAKVRQREGILGVRDYSFCVYPEESLVKLLLDISKNSA
jgi:hypothetical protein